MKLLIVEDNRSLRDMIAAHLTEQGFAIHAVASGTDALAALTETTFNAMVLDLGLPDIDGMQVLRGPPGKPIPPTLIVTARDNVADRIAGLDGGADDYILKPFDLAEFDARLRAVLRRPGTRDRDQAAPRFGDLTFDATNRAARAGDRAVELTAREAALYDILLRAGERVVVRDALAEKLYGADDEISGNALEAVVSRLRRKIASLGSPVRIETLRGLGYRLSRPPQGAEACSK
jgi:DNA-binding response OmpR family regulator